MKKQHIIVFITSILFVGFSCFSFYFLYVQIDQIKSKIKLTHEDWQNEENRREAIKSLERSIKKIEKEKEIIDKHFVQSIDVVSFLDFFEQSGLLIGAKAEVGSVGLDKDQSTILVDINAFGSFESLYKYLRLLENAPYELEVVSFVVNKIGAVNNTIGSWTANFKLKLLSFSK